jgi:putative Holliday junction resolvase
MTTFLGVDFGLKHIGLAISYEGQLAEPLETFSYQDQAEAFRKLTLIIDQHGIESVVFGLPEGKMGQKVHLFVDKLGYFFNGPVSFQDETLSTKEAKRKLIESQRKQQQRKKMIHQFAASLILQEFLDSRKDSLIK